MTVSRIALLTGGGDKPYAVGLASSLAARGVPLDFIGSDELDVPEIRGLQGLRFLNLRRNQDPNAYLLRKVVRVASYYGSLLAYAATAEPRLFHILWNNKFELFDRTALLSYYRLLGKRLIFTVHNVNIGARDGRDGPLNRLSLRAQYALADHLFVHTEPMRRELEAKFGVPAERITTIPFGINTTLPDTPLTGEEARRRLGLDHSHKVLLFFGNIAPYKGVEFLVRATAILARSWPKCRLVVAGRTKGEAEYWRRIDEEINALGLGSRVIRRVSYIPDEEVEVYFKAADVLVLPYTEVFQSGVLFLGYNYGLPAIVSDVGAMAEDVAEGSTGFVCRPRDPGHLAATLDRYFRSALYETLEARRPEIRRLMAERHSWETIAELTCRVYRSLSSEEQSWSHSSPS